MKRETPAVATLTASRAWMLWGAEALLSLLFLWLLYRQEAAVLQRLAGQEPLPLAMGIHQFLQGLQVSWIPGQLWLLTWPLLCLALAMILMNRLRWYFLTLVGLCSSLLLTADEVYHQFFSSVLSLNSLLILNQMWDVRGSISHSLPYARLAYAAIFLLLACFGRLRNRYQETNLSKTPGRYAADKLLGVLFFLLALYAAFIAFYIPSRYVVFDLNGDLTIYDYPPKKGDSYVPLYETSHKDFAVIFGLYNFHLKNVVDGFSALGRQRALAPEELNETVVFLEHRYRLNQNDSPLRGLARGRNLFLISLESLQHFLLDLRLDGEEVTPVLNRLKETALYWPRFIDQSKVGGTSDAEFAVMTGLLPDLRQIASLTTPSQNTLLALPAELKKHGYHSYSFHGHRISFWNRNINHPLFGFQSMFFEESFPDDEVLGLGVPDKLFFSHTLDLLALQETPFFAFLIALSSHHPYADVPADYQTLFPSLPASGEAGRYLRLARYSDDALGGFLEKARARGFWENSIFIIYGDHIAPLREEGRKQMVARTGVEVRSIREMRIPMMILIPGAETEIAAFRQVTPPVVGGLPDIFPTVLHLLGEEVPFGIFGTHLFVPETEREVLPSLRKPGSFFFRGICYDGQPPRPWRDRSGLVFGPEENLLTEPERIAELQHEAVAVLRMHFNMFDHDAQKAAIEARNERDAKEDP